MVKVTIDNTVHEFETKISIIEACHQVGIQIPHFCYHPKLEVAGNCRMCLVDIEGARKPIPSCANNIAEGMVIHTKTQQVKNDREGVMEFLLINHPLDCPICDQAGECNLQEQALHYGRDHSRYAEEKRAVENKYLGPLISTVMTRCIHCTRCVRFAEDLAGVSELGALGRGENMEITTYLEKAMVSELSGNVIDLCPVGALNSKPYQFQGRPWELKQTNSIDVLDALGSHVRIDSRGGQVFRIKPNEMDEINEVWLSDKSRFSYDGLLVQRLDEPYVRNSDGFLAPVDWQKALQVVVDNLEHTSGFQVAALAGDLVDVESMLLMKRLMQHIGSPHMDCRWDGAYADVSNHGSYVFNTSLSDIELADVCLLVGTNPRWEAPVLNLRLRRGVTQNDMKMFRVGFEHDLTYPVEDLGNDLALLNEILEGAHNLSKVLKEAKRPAIIIGQSALKSPQAAVVLNVCAKIADKYGFVHDEGDGWNGFNVLHTSAARVGGLDIGFVPSNGGIAAKDVVAATHDNRLKTVFLMGVESIAPKLSKHTFVVYIGHHGDKGAENADVILPGCAYTEKTAVYTNTEGRSQCAGKAVDAPGLAREDWRIIADILTQLKFSKSYNSLEDVRKDLASESPEFRDNYNFNKREWNPNMGEVGHIKSEETLPVINNFYRTDVISKNSKTMLKCVEEVLNGAHSNVA